MRWTCLIVWILFLSNCFFWPVSEARAVPQSDGKKPLEHEDYDRWNTIQGTTISRDGKWLVFTVRDGKDKQTIKIRNLESPKEYSVVNGAGPRISFDSQHIAYRIIPDKELVKKLKKQDKPESELPQEKFEVLHLESGDQFVLEQVKSFGLPLRNGDWIAILLNKPKQEPGAEETKTELPEKFEITPSGLKRPGKRPAKKTESKKTGSKLAEKGPAGKKPSALEQEPTTEKKAEKETSTSTSTESKKKKEKQEGTTLIVKHLKTGVERRIPHVITYRFDESGKVLAYVTSTKDGGEKDGVSVIELGEGNSRKILSGLGNYKNLVFDKRGSRLAFITDRDDYKSEESSWALYDWRLGQTEAKKIVAEGTRGVPENWWLSSTAAPYFSELGKYLFCYTAPKPDDSDVSDENEKDNGDDPDDNEPTAKLDLWHWQDPLLQPQQLIQAEQEKNRSYLAAYNLRSRKLVQLADKTIPDIFVDAKRNSDIVLGTSNEKYKKTISWDMPGYRDVYLLNARTGKKHLVLEKVRSQPRLSPDGKFLFWWDTESQNWMAISTRPDSDKSNLTDKIEFSLSDELHDTPNDPFPYGVAGWTTGDKHLLVYDRFDIWKLDPTGKNDPQCVTNVQGRETTTTFRFRQLDSEARSIDPKSPMLLTAFDESTKNSGFYWLKLSQSLSSENGDNKSDKSTELTKIMMLPERVAGLRKAQDASRIIFTRSTFRRFPDIWASDMEFETIERISDANPQQDDYAWGSVELTSWTATDGTEIEGLLYKPDDFDPTKKYPLIVYFYERNSDNLHRHYVPAAGRSIINFSFYVSRGYVVFVPDIPYKTGEPGPSAANAVLPGVKHVVDMGFVDEKRIGTQGHSWGGYQTAYLVTQTDMFACAESGAPVSNMTSAYGGIRWASGLSRMFQYERTQSRIGDTLWNARDKYIANSPLFFVDKINTPLLILHNDNDGAVPWYQGIELFVAMRRLEKPAWLLNYNDNPHWVMGRENRIDFAKRMQQFFDHYLKDEPMPQWMASGIPAVDKGKEFGFEFPEEETESEPTTNETESEANPNRHN